MALQVLIQMWPGVVLSNSYLSPRTFDNLSDFAMHSSIRGETLSVSKPLMNSESQSINPSINPSHQHLENQAVHKLILYTYSTILPFQLYATDQQIARWPCVPIMKTSPQNFINFLIFTEHTRMMLWPLFSQHKELIFLPKKQPQPKKTKDRRKRDATMVSLSTFKNKIKIIMILFPLCHSPKKQNGLKSTL